MLFNSYQFLFLFLPVTLALFFGFGRWSHRLANTWMAVASLGFYAWWNPPYVMLLLASILFNYGAGLVLIRAGEAERRRRILAAAIVADLLLLGYFKYADFFLANVNVLFRTDWPLAQIVLPLGISFFTFTQIAFLVDTARGEVAEVDFVRYLLFVSYFPHLIAGPILHHKDMMSQFARPRISRFSGQRLALGLSIFTLGLLKKVLLADNVAGFASPVFDAAARGVPPSLMEAWGAALAYSLQIYFDFSGYSDMAVGLGRMTGVRLPLNFHSPYKSGSIIEFWRRWHMTLSRFLRDYLYIPLGGNRKGPGRRYVNLFATMLLGGLWHGAAWTFVLWGGLHGLYLAVNHAWRSRVRTPRGMPWRLGAQALTFLAVVVAWVPFRAANLDAAWSMLQGMAGGHGLRPAKGLAAAGEQLMARGAALDWSRGWLWIGGLLLVVWLLPNTQEVFSRYRTLGKDHPAADPLPVPRLGLRWRLSPAWAWATAFGTATALLYLGRASEFIYFQF